MDWLIPPGSQKCVSLNLVPVPSCSVPLECVGRGAGGGRAGTECLRDSSFWVSHQFQLSLSFFFSPGPLLFWSWQWLHAVASPWVSPFLGVSFTPTLTCVNKNVPLSTSESHWHVPSEGLNCGKHSVWSHCATEFFCLPQLNYYTE